MEYRVPKPIVSIDSAAGPKEIPQNIEYKYTIDAYIILIDRFVKINTIAVLHNQSLNIFIVSILNSEHTVTRTRFIVALDQILTSNIEFINFL